ncbi:MAG: hypothetical protein LC790_14625 [Actinobacteria bacterium]|nr:hypothetical protein [Actinomycetota bacterium]
MTLFGAAGMYRSGWDELSETFRWIASRFSNVSDYSFEVLVADVLDLVRALARGLARFVDRSLILVMRTTLRSTRFGH